MVVRMRLLSMLRPQRECGMRFAVTILEDRFLGWKEALIFRPLSAYRDACRELSTSLLIGDARIDTLDTYFRVQEQKQAWSFRFGPRNQWSGA